MKIGVIGTGYVGLVTGTCFSETGLEVTCVDINKDKIKNLSKGIIPIYEPGLKEILKRNLDNRRLTFSSNIKECVRKSDVLFITVGTPESSDGSADLSYVLNVAGDIGKYMNKYLVVATKSTVPVGTSKLVKERIDKELKLRNLNINFDVVSNPEFLKEGAAVSDFLKPDRIVVGVGSEQARQVMKKLYKPFTLNGHPIIFMDVTSSEMTKYAANSMLATRISFMNEISNLCEHIGADVDFVRKGIGTDSRIGHHFLFPGIGYGGSCFPKDVTALIKTARKNNYNMKILSAVCDVNKNQKSILFKKLKKSFNGTLKKSTIAIWGLSFKPHTDDLREAPSLTIIDKLIESGCKIKVYDPQAMKEAKKIYGEKIEFAKDQYEALIDANCLLVVTEWPEFRNPNFKIMSKLMKEHIIYDGRNIYEKNVLKEYGFSYFCMGRQT